ncbi:acyl-CoA reductase [Maribacter halichondriae]|uniref:acyl-CoA reductase n=1 Tax=Maribacter halichondriae TaxID=2980554 RepID=UPI00235A449E|nr:acyl-CoA reductase [Maribacter sp. Hal144]
MDVHHRRLQAFVKLGDFLNSYCEYVSQGGQSIENQNDWFSKLDDAIVLAGHKNGWFTKKNILFSIENWAKLLTNEKLNNWLSDYDLKKNSPNNVALIMAGNIPLVGFPDFLAVLLTGNTALVKSSSNDFVLLPFITEFLIKKEPSLAKAIIFKEDRFTDFDKVIATGSNNTARYFEYYFGKVPNIIRKNRNSVAVLNGFESSEQLKALGEDIFRYYGLGCRNVSKIFVPKGYDFDSFFKALYPFKEIIEQVKYANNYDYNKAVYLMSEFDFLDNGFLMLKRDDSFASPIATLFYEEYDDLDAMKARLESDTEKIQCVVGSGILPNEILFGQTQKPQLDDYADGIDTVEFLLKT